MLTEEMIIKPRNLVRLSVVRAGQLVDEIQGLNARVNAGASLLASLAGSAAGVPLLYIALSTATLTPAMTDTTLSSEITGTGLARKAATYGSYTAPVSLNASASYTLTTSFTNNTGSPVTVASAGCLSAITGGTLGFETNFASSTTLQPLDIANISWVFNV